MSEPWTLDLAELSRALDLHQLSPVEIVESFLTRIEALNDTLNAFITVTGEDALVEARRAEKVIIKGRRKGSLHGIPVGHKDLYCTADVRTTAGSRILEEWIPKSSATVVNRLSDAGMISLGKLNTHEFAYGSTNAVSLIGATRNPWNTNFISGGSSGGSATAVAGGLLPIATGTDTGGSIRVPAGCCGLTGLKPTYGRVSRAGILPLSWSMDHAGPIGRSVLDVAMILEHMAGHDPKDITSVERCVPNYVAALKSDIRGLKVGIARRMFFDQAQEAVAGVVDQALMELESLGATLIEVDVPLVENYRAASLAIVLAEATSAHDDSHRQRAHLYSDEIRDYIDMGDHIKAKDYLRAQRYRMKLSQHMAEVLTRVDVIVTPGVALTATALGEKSFLNRNKQESVSVALLRNTEPFNLTGLPALAVPCGFINDLPVSLQIVGNAFNEQQVLNVGHAYQCITDWHKTRPEL